MADHMRPLILTIPGLANSGADHWQTRWEQQRSDCRRVELGQWDQPHRNSWVNQLNFAIRSVGQGAARRPIVLAAHSLGCLAVAWWALLEGDAGALVSGALLVAPPDVDTAPRDPRLCGFAPTPAAPLPFPAILVASRNDPYMTMRAARQLAHVWHASFADAGPVGHINAESGIADWPFGQFLLGRLLAPLTSSERALSGLTPFGGIAIDAPDSAGEASRVAHAREVSPGRLSTYPPPAAG